MPNVLITPRSSEYSDEVWAEVRIKASVAVGKYLTKGVVPSERLMSEDEGEESAEADPGLSTSRDSAVAAGGTHNPFWVLFSREGQLGLPVSTWLAQRPSFCC
jgi:hypothetical protein